MASGMRKCFTKLSVRAFWHFTFSFMQEWVELDRALGRHKGKGEKFIQSAMGCVSCLRDYPILNDAKYCIWHNSLLKPTRFLAVGE